MNINSNFSSPNFAIRDKAIKYIILHYTEMDFFEALTKLCEAQAKVSAHYLIKADGEIYRLVDEDKIAWHAGLSCWHGEDKLNNTSIGIEIDNVGTNPFPEMQIASCIELCKFLMKKYDIPRENIIGHSDIAPERKIDPGIYFDWSKLAEHNIGIWPSMHNLKPNDNIDIGLAQSKLARIGYNIKVTHILDSQTNYVLRAFQSHFCPQIIQAKGVDFYRDETSRYELDPLTYSLINIM